MKKQEALKLQPGAQVFYKTAPWRMLTVEDVLPEPTREYPYGVFPLVVVIEPPATVSGSLTSD